ncbi:MAG: phosphoesterase [Eubacteriales bacterium]|nr:phosphoesterase [Eubacteriales bacterium]
MIDIHCHLIHGVDDGPPTLRESLRMTEEAAKAGTKVIIATPHIKGTDFDFDYIFEHLYDLAKAAGEKRRESQAEVPEIKLGSEVAINPILCDQVKKYGALRLADTRYVLVELPFDIIPTFTRDVLYKLRLKDYIPVIAHPERNRQILKTASFYVELIDSGCLMQLDAASILGKNGRAVKSFCKKVIKANMVHFVATDAHSSKSYVQLAVKSRRRVESWAGRDFAEIVFVTNGQKLLRNEEIESCL